MSAFGERLRREREMRDISLDEISAATKIGTRLLRALEDEQFDLLPGGIFNKGYVRAYAKYVGIDEEEAVADYLRAARLTAANLYPVTEQPGAGRSERASRGTAGSKGASSLPIVPALIVLALVAGAAAGWRIYRERQLDRPQRATVMGELSNTGNPVSAATTEAPSRNASNGGASSTSSAAASPESKVNATPANPLVSSDHAGVSGATHPLPGQTANNPLQAAAARNAAGTLVPSATDNVQEATPFELTVRAKDRAWVSIKSDGKFVVRGIIKPPEVKTIHATSQVVFWTGNAGQVEVSFNGKNVPLSGGENDERVLVFNSHGLLPSAAAQ